LYDIWPGNGAGLFLQCWIPHGAGTSGKTSSTLIQLSFGSYISQCCDCQHVLLSYLRCARISDSRWRGGCMTPLYGWLAHQIGSCTSNTASVHAVPG